MSSTPETPMPMNLTSFVLGQRLNNLAAAYAPAFLTAWSAKTAAALSPTLAKMEPTLAKMEPTLRKMEPTLRKVDAAAAESLDAVSASLSAGMEAAAARKAAAAAAVDSRSRELVKVVSLSVDSVLVKRIDATLDSLETMLGIEVEEPVQAEKEEVVQAEKEEVVDVVDAVDAEEESVTGVAKNVVAGVAVRGTRVGRMAVVAKNKTADALGAQSAALQAKMAASLASVAAASAAVTPEPESVLQYVPFRAELASLVASAYGMVVSPVAGKVGLDLDGYVNTLVSLLAGQGPEPAAPPAHGNLGRESTPPFSPIVHANTSINTTMDDSSMGALDPEDSINTTELQGEDDDEESSSGALDPLDPMDDSEFVDC